MKKSSKTNFAFTFAGRTICEDSAAQTFVLSIEAIVEVVGVERVRAILPKKINTSKSYIAKHSTSHCEDLQIKTTSLSNGQLLHVCTHSSTMAKTKTLGRLLEILGIRGVATIIE